MKRIIKGYRQSVNLLSKRIEELKSELKLEVLPNAKTTERLELLRTERLELVESIREMEGYLR